METRGLETSSALVSASSSLSRMKEMQWRPQQSGPSLSPTLNQIGAYGKPQRCLILLRWCQSRPVVSPWCCLSGELCGRHDLKWIRWMKPIVSSNKDANPASNGC
ncbi:unnamed protein product [Musa banksii]